MLRQRRSPKTSHTMIRSAFSLVMTGALWAGAAHAQMSGADLVTRIDRLQAQVRELTGTVEELQYRNQQLEQEVQRLRAAAPGAATPPTAQSSPPSPRYSSPQYPPATAEYPPPAAPAPGAVASVPASAPPPPLPSSDANLSAARRGDAFDPNRNPTAPGAPLDLSSPLSSASVSPPASAAAATGGDLSPPPPINPSATGAMQAALPPGNTPKDEYDLALATSCTKTLLLPNRPSAISCTNIRATGLRPKRNTGWARVCFRISSIGTPRNRFLLSPPNTRTPRALRTRYCGWGNRLRLWAKKKRHAPHLARCCGNIRALRSA